MTVEIEVREPLTSTSSGKKHVGAQHGATVGPDEGSLSFQNLVAHDLRLGDDLLLIHPAVGVPIRLHKSEVYGASVDDAGKVRILYFPLRVPCKRSCCGPADLVTVADPQAHEFKGEFMPGSRVDESFSMGVSPPTGEVDRDGEGVSILEQARGSHNVARDVTDAVTEWATGSRVLRKLLVLVNPVSGNKRAPTIWATIVQPLFEQCDFLEVVSVITERPNHAYDLVQDDQFMFVDRAPRFRGIVIISGDGLVHEVCSGLRKRGDDLHTKIGLGHVPGGSGNAISLNVLREARQPNQPLAAALLVLKNSLKEVDLWDVSCAGEWRASILTWGWGLVADVDIESEFLRCLAGARFQLYGLWAILRKRIYRGKLSYVGEEVGRPLGQTMERVTSEKSGRTWRTLDCQEFLTVWGSSVRIAAVDAIVAPEAELDDGLYHILYLRASASRCTVLRLMLAMETGSHLKLLGEELGLIRCTAFRFQPKAYSEKRRGLIAVDGEVVPFGQLHGERAPSAQVFCM